MTNSINLVRGIQNIIDSASGDEIFIITWVAADYYHPQNSQVAFIIGSTQNLTTSPEPTFVTQADAIAYYESVNAQNVVDLVNADIGLPYYTAYTITIVDPAVIAAIMMDLTPYLTSSTAASTYVTQTTTVNSHALSANVTITKSDISLGNVVNLDTSTTANITDSSGKRFITDTQKTILMNTSGSNTGDQDLSGLVPNTRKVNGHALSGDVTVTASDIGSPSGSGTSSGTNTGDQDLSGLVLKTTAVNGHALSGNVTVTKSDVSLGNVVNLDTSTTSNITDSTNKRFVTDANIAVLGNTSGTNTGDQNLSAYVTSTSLTSTLSSYATSSSVTSGLAGKQGTITTGSSSQYLKADLSLGTFLSDVRGAISVTGGGSYNSSTGVITTPSATKVYFGSTLQSAPIMFTASATVGSGVAVFQLTTDGTSTGTAIFPSGPNMDSINAFVSDATASYQMGYALTNSNKTLTITANKLTTANILTGLLGQAAANAAVVRLTIWGS